MDIECWGLCAQSQNENKSRWAISLIRSYCNTAMHITNHHLNPVLLNFFVPFSQEEEEEEGRQEEA